MAGMSCALRPERLSGQLPRPDGNALFIMLLEARRQGHNRPQQVRPAGLSWPRK